MFNTKALSRTSATYPLAATSIPRGVPTDRNEVRDKLAMEKRAWLRPRTTQGSKT